MEGIKKKKKRKRQRERGQEAGKRDEREREGEVTHTHWRIWTHDALTRWSGCQGVPDPQNGSLEKKQIAE